MDLWIEVTSKIANPNSDMHFCNEIGDCEDGQRLGECNLSAHSRLFLTTKAVLNVTDSDNKERCLLVDLQSKTSDFITVYPLTLSPPSEEVPNIRVPVAKRTTLSHLMWSKKQSSCKSSPKGPRCFNIRVKLPKDKKQVIRPRNSDVSIAEVKGIIDELETLSSDQYILTFHKRNLMNKYSLGHYNIRRGCNLKLQPKKNGFIEVFVEVGNTLSPARFVMDIWDTVQDLRDVLNKKKGFEAVFQLNFKKQPLLGECFLISYNITSKSTLKSQLLRSHHQDSHRPRNSPPSRIH